MKKKLFVLPLLFLLSACGGTPSVPITPVGPVTPTKKTDGTFRFEGNKVMALNTNISGDLVIPESFEGVEITEISEKAFKNCTEITSLVVPNTIKTIGNGAFNGCIKLKSITLPFVGKTRTSKGKEGVFGYPFGTSSYTGGNAVSQYYTDAMANRYTTYIPATLKEVKITDATGLSDGAFYNMEQLKKIELNDGILGMGIYCFCRCKSIEELSLMGVNKIEKYTFQECESLKKVSFGKEVTSIELDAFCDCISLTQINSEVEGVFNIPNNVKTIENSAFSGCVKVKTISLPFVGNSRTIPNVNVKGGTFGCIFGTKEYVGSTECTQRYGSSYGSNANYYIPSGLKEIIITDANGIGYGAFMNISMIDSLKINKTAQEIVGEKAFENCSAEPNWID